MQFVLWTALNLFLGAGILYFIFRIARIIYLRYGMAVSILALLALCCVNFVKKQPAENGSDRSWTFTPRADLQWFKDSYTSRIYDNPMFGINLFLETVSDKDRLREEPTRAMADLEGYSGHYVWYPTDVSVTAGTHSFHYIVNGVIDWRILGISVFSQNKIITGEIPRH